MRGKELCLKMRPKHIYSSRIEEKVTCGSLSGAARAVLTRLHERRSSNISRTSFAVYCACQRAIVNGQSRLDMSSENCTQEDAAVVESVGCAGQCQDNGVETFALRG